jgi:hypothetical protein
MGQALEALFPAAVEARATNGRATPRMTNKRPEEIAPAAEARA